MAHIPVLLKEVIDGLGFSKKDEIKKDEIFLDATVGGGGHSLEICRQFPEIKIVGIDVDQAAVKRSQDALSRAGCRFELKHGNFREIDRILSELAIEKVDKVLLDLGFSSDQIETSVRGFSFQKDEPLIMSLNSDWQRKLTAYEIVNGWSKEDLQEIFTDYGEESYAGKIADRIVKQRKLKAIETTKELAGIIEEVIPKNRNRKKNPATKVFQALRIAVNDELGALKEGLEKIWRVLVSGGRIGVISFHSLEDRIVKNFFKELKDKEEAILITKRPIVPGREEILLNKRARSAKLRIIQK